MQRLEGEIPFHNQVLRRFASDVVTRGTMRIEVKKDQESRAKLAYWGDRPKIQVYDHWGVMEIASIIKRNFQHPAYKTTPMLSPWAIHRYNRKWGNVGTNLLGVRLDPTLTPDAKDYYKKHPDERPTEEQLKSLNSSFIKDSLAVFDEKGMAMIASQGRREEFITTEPKTPILRTYLTGLENAGFNLTELIFEFVTTELQGVDYYDYWKDVKWSKPHPPLTVKDGPVYTFRQALEESGGKLRYFDKWAANVLYKSVPPARKASAMLFK